MRWEYLWLTLPLVGLSQALLLYRDSGRTLRAVHSPPMGEPVLRLMAGNHFRDALRSGMWLAYLGTVVLSTVLVDVVPYEHRVLLARTTHALGGVLLYLSGRSDAADRRNLAEHHRPAAEREARRR